MAPVGVLSRVPTPDHLDPRTGGFFSVAAGAASSMWAVGYYVANATTNPVQATLIEHWNGTNWSIVSSSNVASDANRLFGVAFISTSNVWTVGYSTPSCSFDRTLTEHWNGTSWSIVASPNVGSANNDLNGVTTIPANNQVWTAGFYDTNPTPQTLTEFHC